MSKFIFRIQKMDEKKTTTTCSLDNKSETFGRFQEWKKKFVDDLRNPKLLPLKCLMFIVFGGKLRKNY